MPRNPNIFSQALGSTASRQLTLYDSTGALVTTYTNSNALSAKIWTGQEQIYLVAPTIAWINPTLGTVQLTITAANLAALPSVGLFSIQCWVTDNGGNPILFFDGMIEVTPSPGSVTALSTDITYNDLLLYSTQIETLQDSESDQAGFIPERHRAQTWFKEGVVNKYRPQNGRSKRYLNAAGTGSGSFLAFSLGPAGQDAPSLAALLGYFSNGGLCLTDLIREAQAHFAAALVLLSQPGRDNPYRETGLEHLAMAATKFEDCIVELDTSSPPSSPPTPLIRVDRDVIWLT